MVEVGQASAIAGRLREAEGQFKEALHISKMKNNLHGKVAALNGLGEIAQTQGRPNDAELFLLESLSLQQHIVDKIGEADARKLLGEVKSGLRKIQ